MVSPTLCATYSNSLRSRTASPWLRTLALGPTGMSMTMWVEPAASFLDRIEATICSGVSMLSGRSTEISTSSAGDRFIRPPHASTAFSRATIARMRSAVMSTLASTSIVSAVPEGEVIARDDVLGMISPCAATIGTTIIEVRLPGTPPMQCLSTTSGACQSSRLPTSAIARVSASVSGVVMKPAQATRNAPISIGE